GEPAQLDLLPRRNIRKPFAELAADFGERAQLGCGRDAVRNPHAHHKMTRRLAAEKDPGPFKPLLVAFSDGFPPFRGVTRNVLEHIQPIFFLFVFFDLVHLPALIRHSNCRTQTINFPRSFDKRSPVPSARPSRICCAFAIARSMSSMGVVEILPCPGYKTCKSKQRSRARESR